MATSEWRRSRPASSKASTRLYLTLRRPAPIPQEIPSVVARQPEGQNPPVFVDHGGLAKREEDLLAGGSPILNESEQVRLAEGGTGASAQQNQDKRRRATRQPRDLTTHGSLPPDAAVTAGVLGDSCSHHVGRGPIRRSGTRLALRAAGGASLSLSPPGAAGRLGHSSV